MPTPTYRPHLPPCLPACDPPILLHRADLAELHCHGRRAARPARPRHRHRDAHRRPAGRVWHHTRAHRFFSVARRRRAGRPIGSALRCCAVLEVIVTLLVDPAEPLLVVDDSRVKRRFKRRGRKVYGSAMHSDPTATGRRTVWGNNWVVVGILVALPAVPTAGCACRWGPAVAAPPPQGHPAPRNPWPAG